MALLMVGSGLFSSSEAALFCLGHDERRAMRKGNRAERLACQLLDRPQRLLGAVLFWNLVINMAYFALASSVGLKLQQNGESAAAGMVAVVSLFAIILMSEMLPKNIAVLRPRLVAGLVSMPLAVVTRIVDPLMPALELVNSLSIRLVLPNREKEPYLDLIDLEQAISLSSTNKEVLLKEQQVLQNLVMLSELRVEELMRPRVKYLSFRPPVSLQDLQGKITPSGYLLVTEEDSDEIAGAISLRELTQVPEGHWEHIAEKVLTIPWCATAAMVLQEMNQSGRNVAAVLNEYGETIGIVTLDDIVEFITQPTLQDDRSFHRVAAIQELEPNIWLVTGMTSLRRLAKHLKVKFPQCKSVTVAGVLQEELQRLPLLGDGLRWGPGVFTVVSLPERGQIVVRIELHNGKEEHA